MNTTKPFFEYDPIDARFTAGGTVPEIADAGIIGEMAVGVAEVVETAGASVTTVTHWPVEQVPIMTRGVVCGIVITLVGSSSLVCLALSETTTVLSQLLVHSSVITCELTTVAVVGFGQPVVQDAVTSVERVTISGVTLEGSSEVGGVVDSCVSVGALVVGQVVITSVVGAVTV